MIANIWYIARRELGAIFVQPIAYLFMAAILLITGLVFAVQLATPLISGGAPATLGEVLNSYAFLLLFAVPAITMRLLAEEQQRGTIELLMTLPVRDSELVWGKFLAGFLTLLAMTGLTLVYPIILWRFGNPDLNVLWVNYAGILLWICGLLGIGLFTSALSESQLVAFILALFFNLLLYMSAAMVNLVAPNLTNALLSNLLQELSYQTHLVHFLQGVVAATDLLYYLSITLITLFATTRLLESRRWR